MNDFKVRGVLNAAVLLSLLAASCGFVTITPLPSAKPVPIPASPILPTLSPAPPAPAFTPPPASAPLVPLPAKTAPVSPGAPVFQLPNIADVVAAVKPGVVAINTETVTLDFFNRPLRQQGVGSGWIIDPNGTIVTNNHVVEGARTITVTLDDGSTFTVEPGNVFVDDLNDLAILKINARNLPALKVGDSGKLRVGDWVVAIGNSLGLGISAKQGIISRKGVTVPVDQGQTLYDLIETSAAINPGNSGGPLVNLSGEAIGITSAKIATVGVEGMGYAISSGTAMPILQQLIFNGFVVRSWIGVTLYTVDRFAVIRYRLAVNKGALVTRVVSGGPAARGGLQPGDVVVAASGKDVASEQELNRVIYSATIGQPLDIAYYRGDAKRTTQVAPAQSPPPK